MTSRAERVVDAGFAVDEDAKLLRAAQFHGEDLDAGQAAAHRLGDLAVQLALCLVHLRHLLS